jgi:voltage-gated potassium channel
MSTRKYRHAVYEILELGATTSRLGGWFDAFMVGLILLNVVAVTVETVDWFFVRYKPLFNAFEAFSVAIFAAEYVARLWVCVENLQYNETSPLRSRLKYARSFPALVDLAAFAPALLWFIALPDLRVLRVLRLVRLLKLVRYSPALGSLGRVLYDERHALAATFVIMAGLLTFSASVIYYLENAAQPEVFSSIPAAMWWALVTLTTVGYGDIVPITPLGKTFGGLVTLFGLGMFALPIGIIASGFANEIHRREFVVNWGMIARVPLFARLDAMAIARIAELLRTRVVAPGSIISRRGDQAECMFFIVSGEVEVNVRPKPVRLREGEFFGEIALLRDTRRQATVRAVSKVQLMVLEKADLHHLMHEHPEIATEITEIARQRVAQGYGDAADERATGLRLDDDAPKP